MNTKMNEIQRDDTRSKIEKRMFSFPSGVAKTVTEISSCGQEETPSNPFLLIRDSLQTNGY